MLYELRCENAVRRRAARGHGCHAAGDHQDPPGPGCFEKCIRYVVPRCQYSAGAQAGYGRLFRGNARPESRHLVRATHVAAARRSAPRITAWTPLAETDSVIPSYPNE